jgi:hypothetical protein
MTYSRIEIVVDRRGSRRWHERLRDRLARVLPESAIRFRLVDGADGFPTAITRLLALERLLLRHSRPTLSDSAQLTETKSLADFEPSIVIDCTGREHLSAQPNRAMLLRPLYDGNAGETAAAAALLARACPSISIENVNDGTIVATGLPSLEAADGLTGGLEAVVSRVITLIEKTLLSPRGTSHARKSADVAPAPRALAFLLRNMAYHCAREIYHLCCHSPHWRVGWRFTDGPGVLETGGLSGIPWRVLTNLGDAYAADPFPIEWRGKTCVFFEQFDHRVGRGRIFAQEFESERPAGEPFLVLEEPWHLSYPFLIARGQELYLMPEASLSGAVPLYRCVEFPRKWELVAHLLTEIEAADATIFRHAEKYWMTSVIRDGVGGYSDTLAIHHAPDLLGPWQEHARRPVLVDSRFARPAGAVVERDGVLWRPIQDCSTGYGKKLALARIDVLDPENFSQTVTCVIPPGPLWPGDRLHTLNRCGRLECIDGAVLTPKNRTARRLASGFLDH